MNYYEILGVGTESGFSALKKAYYKRARECHPDRFGNDPEKAEEFRMLVEAFVTLSDPDKRRNYDAALRLGPMYVVMEEGDVIMDSDSDDTLEELVVGNDPPPDTTLFTFFRDLERTLVFMTSREARNYFEKKKYRTAARLYERLVMMAPGNILYRVYFARCLTQLGNFRQASLHYHTAIALGKHRDPPQHLLRVHQEIKELNKKRLPFFAKLMKILFEEEQHSLISPEEEMIAEAERAMSRMLREEASRKQITHRRQELPPGKNR